MLPRGGPVWACQWWGPEWAEEACSFSLGVSEIAKRITVLEKRERENLVRATYMKGFYISKPHLLTIFRSLA